MNSFLKLWETMNSTSSGQTDPASEVIRSGIGIRDKFWEEFILLINNNSKGLSELLDIPAEKIKTWQEKIEDKIKEIESSDTNPSVNKNNKIIKTGISKEY